MTNETDDARSFRCMRYPYLESSANYAQPASRLDRLWQVRFSYHHKSSACRYRRPGTKPPQLRALRERRGDNGGPSRRSLSNDANAPA